MSESAEMTLVTSPLLCTMAQVGTSRILTDPAVPTDWECPTDSRLCLENTHKYGKRLVISLQPYVNTQLQFAKRHEFSKH